MTPRLGSLIPVWVLVVVGIILVATIARPAAYFEWFSVVMAGAVLLTFVIQMFRRSHEGLVVRVMASIGGSVVLLAIGTVILLPAALHS